MMNSSIFRAYDIRGAYPGELDERAAETIGTAFARMRDFGAIAVGHDCRLSSPPLARAFIRGYAGAGGQVTDFGPVSTPFLYYAIIRGAFAGGAMITASHLPPAMNGIKLCREKAIPLSGDAGLPALRRIAEEIAGNPGAAMAGGRQAAGTWRPDGLADEYAATLAGLVRNPRPLAIAVDAGDGMAGPELCRFFPRFPVLEPVILNREPDGTFPHHGANPFLPHATDELGETTRGIAADFGVAFDGDADRCLVVDEHGEPVPADLIAALLAVQYLDREPGATILYDLRSSRIVPTIIREHGGRAVRSRVGHAFIKAQMREEDAIFAAELSGHYYFRDAGYCDNGMMAMIELINLLSRTPRPLSELVRPLALFFRTGEINIRSGHPDRVLPALESAFAGAEIDHLDGLTVGFPDWWFNLRASNTEPVLRLNLEAQTAAGRDRKKEDVLRIIRDADPAAVQE